MDRPLAPSAHGLLTPIQRAFLSVFATLPDQANFYLTGGTALSEFYLGHRLSFDLGFFTPEQALILPFSYQVEGLGKHHDIEISVVRRFAPYVEFLATLSTESLRVDLALDSPFRFASPLPCEYGVRVSPFADLKVDKLLAFYGRAEPRDAVDLYCILQQEPITPLLEMAAQKDPGFDLYWFAVALGRVADFPDELDRWPVKMLVELSPPKLKRMFENLATDMLNRIRSADG
jgi:hypothetical protein